MSLASGSVASSYSHVRDAGSQCHLEAMSYWGGESDLGEDDFWGVDLQDQEGLGDLSDVPQAHLREVVDLLSSLPGPADDPGDIPALRVWIQQIGRLAGFSREATIRLFATISQCLEAVRSKGFNITTKEDLQKAFVRMHGVRETINIMLLRLNDPAIVAQATRVLATAIQGSPLAADAMFDDGTDKVRLMLRAIERHDDSSAVAENACLLISHLCSLTAWPGAPAAPARVTSHRNIQSALVTELGAIDLLVHFLDVSVSQVKELTKKTELLYQKTMQSKKSLALPKPGKPGTPAQAAPGGTDRATMELQQSWVHLNAAEATGARIQGFALQALILLAFGNPATTRSLAGELWIWGNANSSRLKDVSTSKPSSAPGISRSASGRAKPLQKGSKKQGPPQQVPDAAAEVPGLENGVKSSLTTLDNFSKVSMLLLEVLHGRCSRDRPALAAQACRLLATLAGHSIGLLEHIEAGQHKQHAEMIVKMRPGTVPCDNVKPNAPFALIKDIICALTFVLRLHKKDATLLFEALSLLVKLKELALLAAPPAGVEHRGENLLYAWQHLLAEAEQSGEIESANSFLKQALEETDVANERMRVTGTSRDQLSGDASYLTPRLQEAVVRTTHAASVLVGDSLASRWRNGEPGRRSRQIPQLAEGGNTSARSARSAVSTTSSKLLHSGAEANKGAKKAVKLGGAGVPHDAQAKSTARARRKPPSSEQGRRNSTEVPHALANALSQLNQEPPPQPQPKLSRAAATGTLKRPVKPITEKKEEKPATQQKENAESPEWNRALGYDTHDAEDFERVWHKPLCEALQRSLEMPPIDKLRAQKKLETGLQANPTNDCLDADVGTAPRVFSLSTVDVQFIESSPGLLRTKLVLPSLDAAQFRAAQGSLRSLIGDDAGTEVNNLVSKHLRRSGYLMPTHGIQVQLKKGSRQTLQHSASQPLQPALLHSS